MTKPLPPTLSELAVEADIAEAILSPGLVLVAGRKGSGRTSLLSAAVRAGMEKDSSGLRAVILSRSAEHNYADVPGTSVALHLGIARGPRDARRPSPMRDGIVSAMKMGASTIVADGISEADQVDKATFAGLSGHAVLASVQAGDAVDVLQWAAEAYAIAKPARGGSWDRAMLLEGLRMVVAQRLLPGIDGGLVACREYLVLDDVSRKAFAGDDTAHWGDVFSRLVDSPGVKGRSFARSAELLVKRGLVTQAAVEGFVPAVAAA